MAGNPQFSTILLTLGPEAYVRGDTLTMEGASIFTLIITILNILLTTIPSLIDKGEQIKNFKRRLEPDEYGHLGP